MKFILVIDAIMLTPVKNEANLLTQLHHHFYCYWKFQQLVYLLTFRHFTEQIHVDFLITGNKCIKFFSPHKKKNTEETRNGKRQFHPLSLIKHIY